MFQSIAPIILSFHLFPILDQRCNGEEHVPACSESKQNFQQGGFRHKPVYAFRPRSVASRQVMAGRRASFGRTLPSRLDDPGLALRTIASKH